MKQDLVLYKKVRKGNEVNHFAFRTFCLVLDVFYSLAIKNKISLPEARLSEVAKILSLIAFATTSLNPMTYAVA